MIGINKRLIRLDNLVFPRKVDFYPDVKIFLFSIPLINLINYHLTYSSLALNPYFFITYSIDTAIGFLAWLFVRRIVLVLEDKFDLYANPPLRILVQIASTTASGLFLIAVITEILSYVVRGDFAPLNFYSRDLLIIGIWIIAANGIYFGIILYRDSLGRSKESKGSSGKVYVRKGRSVFALNSENVLIVISRGNYVEFHDENKMKYVHQTSLDKVSDLFPDQMFYRVNRKFLINRSQIRGYTRIENNKLRILLNSSIQLDEEVVVSRNKAPRFIDWLKNTEPIHH